MGILRVTFISYIREPNKLHCTKPKAILMNQFCLQNSTMCVLLVFGNIDGQTKREEPILIGTGMFQDKCIAFDIRKERMTFVRSTHGECSSKENDGKHPAMFDERINFASTVENGQ